MTFSSYSLETSTPNSVLLDCSSPQIFKNSRWGSFQFPDSLSNPLQIKNVISEEHLMILTWKLEHNLNLRREMGGHQKRSCHVSVLCHHNFSDLQPFGEIQSWIPAAWSMIFHFALTIRLKETKNRTKKSLTQPWCYFRKQYYFCLKILTFCQETAKVNKS